MKAKSQQELDAIQDMKENIDKLKKGLDSLIKGKRIEIEELMKEQKDKTDSFTTELQNKINEYQNLIDVMKPEKTSTDWFIKGVEAYQSKDYKKAVEYYEKAIELDPNNSRIHNNLGNVLDDLGRHEEAIKKYKRAIELDSNNDKAYYNLGIVLGELKQSEEAIKMYEKAITIAPNNINAYNNYGFELIALEKYKETIEVCKSYWIRPW